MCSGSEVVNDGNYYCTKTVPFINAFIIGDGNVHVNKPSNGMQSAPRIRIVLVNAGGKESIIHQFADSLEETDPLILLTDAPKGAKADAEPKVQHTHSCNTLIVQSNKNLPIVLNMRI